jgi:PAS domain S-box-containing protein
MLARPKLLFVDDYPGNLVAFEAAFKGENYEITLANSGAAALEFAELKQFDVILLDIQMPDMDGYETARRLKKMERYKNVPILFVTAVYTEPWFVRRGYEVGAIDYFTKPFDPEILKRKVEIYSAISQRELLLKEKVKRISETERLLEGGQEFREKLGDTPSGVIITDVHGAVLYTNNELDEICSCFKVNGKPAHMRFVARVQECIECGESLPALVTQEEAKDGSFVTIQCSVAPIRDRNQRISGAVVLVQDLTDTKKLWNHIERKLTELASPRLFLAENAQ